jgi:hypothetical protein
MRLTDTIKIRSTPERFFAFFQQMEQNYLKWHPDHRLFRWEEGRGLREGVTFYFEEVIGGKLMKKKVVFTRIEPGRHIEFTFTNLLLRLILRASFSGSTRQRKHQLFAEIRSDGSIGAWLNRKEFDAVRTHMREEGENLKRILEAANAGSHR